MSQKESEICGFYEGRSVFITGASGFLGKVLLEKLLRSCSGIRHIYILLRPKKGRSVEERLEDLTLTKVFDELKTTKPSALSKVIPIEGDIAADNLGISLADIEIIINNVSVVFHSAATVRFEEPLKYAVQQNVVAVKNVVELCRNMKHLSALIYVSTAFSSPQQKEQYEVLYPPPTDPRKMIDFVQWMDNDIINDITPRLLGDRPNTYTYTKSLAENLFADMASSLPACIVRPSIIGSSWREPFPGWIDSINGPVAGMTGVGTGLIRSFKVDPDLLADIVPVDLVVNLLIALASKIHSKRRNKVQVYNCCSSTTNALTWGLFWSCLTQNMVTNPLSNVVWYPAVTRHSSELRLKIDMLLLHMFPAYVVDTILRIFKKKPFLAKIQRKIWSNMGSVFYFCQRDWRFFCPNTTQLLAELTPEDKRLFDFDLKSVEWPEYLKSFFAGLKYHILKDRPGKNVNLTRFYIIYRAVHVLLIILFFEVFQTSYLTGLFLLACYILYEITRYL